MIGTLVVNNDRSLMSMFSSEKDLRISSSAPSQLYTLEYKYLETFSLNAEYAKNNLTVISHRRPNSSHLDIDWLRFGITYQNEDFMISGESYRVHGTNMFGRTDHPSGYYGLFKYYFNCDTTLYLGYVDASSLSNDIRGNELEDKFHIDGYPAYNKDIFFGFTYIFDNDIKLVMDYHIMEGTQFIKYSNDPKPNKYWDVMGFALTYNF
jgi:hypothetical protein